MHNLYIAGAYCLQLDFNNNAFDKTAVNKTHFILNINIYPGINLTHMHTAVSHTKDNHLQSCVELKGLLYVCGVHMYNLMCMYLRLTISVCASIQSQSYISPLKLSSESLQGSS